MAWRENAKITNLRTDHLYVMGAPVFGGWHPFGDRWYVDYANGSDTGNSGKKPDDAFKTLSTAIDACTTNNNDIIFIDGHSTVVETSMVSLSKNRVHIVGVNGPPGHFGAGAKISCTITSGATNIGTFQNTGVRNTFTGIKFMNASTVAEGVYSLVDAGEYARYFNCEFYKSTDLAVAAASEVIANGDSSMFYNCTFGDLVNKRTANGARPNVLIDREIVSGKVCRDNYFEGCRFLYHCGDADQRFVYATTTNDAERIVHFNRCSFICNPLGSATMLDAIDNNTTNAYFLVDHCSFLGPTNVCADADTTTYIIGSSPVGTTAGLAVEASAA